MTLPLSLKPPSEPPSPPPPRIPTIHEDYLDALERIEKRAVIGPRYLVLEELEPLNVVNDFTWLLDRAGSIVFSAIREDAYEVITREFVISFEHNVIDRTVPFRLMEENYEFSILQFGAFFGFQETFNGRFPSGVYAKDFWEDIAMIYASEDRWQPADIKA